MKKEDIICLDFVKSGDNLWFVDFHFGGLWKINLSSGLQELVMELPKGDAEAYRALYLINDKVFMPPLFSEDFLICDVAGKEIKKISLADITDAAKPNFAAVCEYDGYIYALPMAAKAIVRINISNFRIDTYDIPDEILKRGTLGRPRFRMGSFDGERIYLPECGENKMLVFDVLYCTYTETCVPMENSIGISSCLHIGNKLFVTSYDNKSGLILDEDLNTVTNIELKGDGDHAITFPAGEDAAYISCSGDEIIQMIDINAGTVRILNVASDLSSPQSELVEKYPKNSFVFSAKYIEGEIWAYVTQKGCICVFDINGILKRKISVCNIAETDRIWIQDKLVKNLIKKLEQENPIYEDNNVELEEFIQAIEER